MNKRRRFKAKGRRQQRANNQMFQCINHINNAEAMKLGLFFDLSKLPAHTRRLNLIWDRN